MPAKRHGQTETKLYKIWCGMLTRCTNSKRRNYKWYGARGIKVCDRWKVFEHFRDDMGEPPRGATLDRKERDGNYEPNNCRWASNQVQHNNRSNNRRIVVNGESITVAESARASDVSYTTIVARLNRGWSGDEAVSRPADGRFDRRGKP